MDDELDSGEPYGDIIAMGMTAGYLLNAQRHQRRRGLLGGAPARTGVALAGSSAVLSGAPGGFS